MGKNNVQYIALVFFSQGRVKARSISRVKLQVLLLLVRFTNLLISYTTSISCTFWATFKKYQNKGIQVTGKTRVMSENESCIACLPLADANCIQGHQLPIFFIEGRLANGKKIKHYIYKSCNMYGIRLCPHTHPAYGTLEGEGLHGSLLLCIGVVATLLLGRLLGLIPLLWLGLLVSSSHSATWLAPV